VNKVTTSTNSPPRLLQSSLDSIVSREPKPLLEFECTAGTGKVVSGYRQYLTHPATSPEGRLAGKNCVCVEINDMSDYGT
jgi:hypothetical protein